MFAFVRTPSERFQAGHTAILTWQSWSARVPVSEKHDFGGLTWLGRHFSRRASKLCDYLDTFWASKVDSYLEEWPNPKSFPSRVAEKCAV